MRQVYNRDRAAVNAVLAHYEIDPVRIAFIRGTRFKHYFKVRPTRDMDAFWVHTLGDGKIFESWEHVIAHRTGKGEAAFLPRERSDEDLLEILNVSVKNAQSGVDLIDNLADLAAMMKLELKWKNRKTMIDAISERTAELE